jgi:UDP-N-acetylglucosamine transferase subunit ALG13
LEENIRQKKLLICVLNWGIGHASRVIPIIRLLLKYGQTVYLASDGDALAFLRREFPDLEYCELPPYDPIYPAGNSGMMGKILFQLPKFSAAIRQEHIMVERIVKEKRIDIVISENRYGCYSTRVRSILITHQINIQMPNFYGFMEPFVNYYNWRQIKRFFRVWVPDFRDDRNLTGNLSSSNTVGRRYIGQLSRMQHIPNVERKYDIMALISGPEPQRTIFENMMRNQLFNYHGSSLLVKGKPTGSSEIKTAGRLSEVDFLDTKELNLAIEQSEMLICRSGYSTIMDLAKLGKNAIFVPTPGQTEQIYLAKVLFKKGICYFKDQADFKLAKALPKTKLYSGFKAMNFENEILEEIIIKILK